MSKKTSNERRVRRQKRVRAKITGTTLRPRLAVYRTLRHIRAQVIDDAAGKTLIAAGDLELKANERKGKKLEQALLVGELLGERAKAKGITQVVFDRRDKKYHGRVRAVAEGARKTGLIF